MDLSTLPLKNLKRKAGRTTALIVVVVLLSISMLGGSLIVTALERGLNSLETRLGADIIIVPDEAKSKKDLESILLDGVPGYFYMDKSYYDKVAAVDGIDKISSQYYLASQKAGCCTMPVQIIGFNPDTDFTITPWIKQSGGKELGLLEVVAGYNINKSVGDSLEFFGQKCKIVSKLDRTGTELDNAVYANFETISSLVESSKTTSFSYFSKQSPQDSVSSILVNVQDGYSIDDVVADINIHIKGVEAVATKSMLSGVSDSLQGVARIIKLLIGAVWVLVLIILLVVFSSMINERKKEFAVLRVVGMSKNMLARIVLKENALISLIGGAVGSLISIVMLFPFSTIIENELGLPFLMPSVAKIAGMTVATILLTVIVSALTSAHEAIQLSKVDTGLILREGN